MDGSYDVNGKEYKCNVEVPNERKKVIGFQCGYPNVKDVVADLNKLHAIYNSVVDGAISVEQLAAIKAEVNSIRGKIVQ